MQKVVLVDDNRLEIAAIEKKIEWDAVGCTLVGIASDGISGRDMIRRLKPDIVITDIRMPGLDGLDMIEQVREDLADAVFIVLTGYEDFNYARTAVRLHIFEYLLKPVRLSEMENTLLRAVAESRRKGRTRAIRDEAEAIRYKQRMADLIAGNSVPDETLFNGRYRLFVYLADSAEKLPRAELTAVVESPGNALEHVCLIRDDQFIYIHHLIEGQRENTLHPRLVNVFERAHTNYFCDYTENLIDSQQLCAAYRDISKRLSFKRFCALEGIDDSASGPFSYTDDLQGLIDGIREGTDEDVDRGLRRVLQDIVRSADNDITAARLALYNVYLAMEQMHGPSRRWTLKDVTGIRDLRQSYILLREMAASIRDRGQTAQKKTSLLSYRITQYIIENAAQDLRLTTVADAFYVSPNHVSKVIRQSTGKSFTQYLNDVRIERACELLSDPRIRINEIATMVGYNDYSYFYQVFKRYQNMSPLEYRNSFAKET